MIPAFAGAWKLGSCRSSSSVVYSETIARPDASAASAASTAKVLRRSAATTRRARRPIAQPYRMDLTDSSVAQRIDLCRKDESPGRRNASYE